MTKLEDNSEELILIFKVIKKNVFFFLFLAIFSIIFSYILTNYLLPKDKITIINNNILNYPEIDLSVGTQYDKLFSNYPEILRSDYYGMSGEFFSKEIKFKEVQKIINNTNQLILNDLNTRKEIFDKYFNMVPWVKPGAKNVYFDRNINVIRILNILKKNNNEYYSIYEIHYKRIENFLVYIFSIIFFIFVGFLYKNKNK